MPFFQDFFGLFLTYSVTMMVFTDGCPPPTDLTYKWLDPFTVNISWKRPMGLPDNTTKYQITNHKGKLAQTPHRNYSVSLLTEEEGKGYGHWTFSIQTFSEDCKPSNESTPANITIYSPKTRAELVKDIKCFISSKEMNCSWIPTNPSLTLNMFYSICGCLEESLKTFKKCDRPFSDGKRNVCEMHTDAPPEEVCILVETEAKMSTFKPELVVPSLKPKVTEEGDYLKLSWTRPVYGSSDCWKYNICYTYCNESICQDLKEENMMKVPYVKNCFYEFRFTASTTERCIKVISNTSEVVTYGTHVPSDRTLTVVAIVLPIILSACIILSCYCFRRHREIICPNIPDPSAIFKEMMMNGNKELKTTTSSLYSPVPEPIEPCRITLVTESSAIQQNY
ncbi:interleukin-13 receptor subunit alpha-1 [Dicentrarchus labrax]|uniref:Interleukin 13 receptor subunit alpha 1 n=1 Tax=Dicentrarchus labrax TaxID=13489 RepID=A0A1S5QNM7_DICLA|nr:interleukin-13 receptor subunit alpha-1 [Dicentrarchus labrax]AMO26205.1 interleukin 13 receptor subunit alpha 1 [Dicentrarchus labrax]